MKRLNVYISAVQGAFEQRPEVFQAIRVNVALRVTNGMVDNASVIVAFKIVVGHERVGTDHGTFNDLLADIAAKFRSASVGYHLQNNTRMFVRSCSFQD